MFTFGDSRLPFIMTSFFLAILENSMHNWFSTMEQPRGRLARETFWLSQLEEGHYWHLVGESGTFLNIILYVEWSRDKELSGPQCQQCPRQRVPRVEPTATEKRQQDFKRVGERPERSKPGKAWTHTADPVPFSNCKSSKMSTTLTLSRAMSP